jgi:hypothetical protein
MRKACKGRDQFPAAGASTRTISTMVDQTTLGTDRRASSFAHSDCERRTDNRERRGDQSAFEALTEISTPSRSKEHRADQQYIGTIAADQATLNAKQC